MTITEITHPRVRDLETKMQLGRAEAELFLRAQAQSDASAKEAIDTLDRNRAEHKARVIAKNEANAKEIGLDMDGLNAIVWKLAVKSDLFSWLCARVHVTMAHDRELESHE